MEEKNSKSVKDDKSKALKAAMDQIEKQFDAILSEMAVANSIFCDKSNI